MLDDLHRLYPDKPLLVTEFGAEAVAGFDPATANKRSRDYREAAQVSFLQTHLEQIFAPERRGFVAGGVVWVYNDFPDPHATGGDHPESARFVNTKGVVRVDRTRKPSYEAVKAFFAKVQAGTK